MSVRSVKQPWFMRLAQRAKNKGNSRLIMDREKKSPYLERFYIVPRWWSLGLFNVVIHRFHRSDSTHDGLHDHPWPFLSIILKGGYWEWVLVNRRDVVKHHAHEKIKARRRGEGDFVFAHPWHLHRVELFQNMEGEVWTMVIFGPRIRSWRFLVDGKFYPWREWIGIRRNQKPEDVTNV